MISFFAELGRQIERRWRAKDYDDAAFAEIAYEALLETPPADHVDPTQVIRSLCDDEGFVTQVNPAGSGRWFCASRTRPSIWASSGVAHAGWALSAQSKAGRMRAAFMGISSCGHLFRPAPKKAQVVTPRPLTIHALVPAPQKGPTALLHCGNSGSHPFAPEPAWAHALRARCSAAPRSARSRATKAVAVC